MRLGLIADVHEAIPQLNEALSRLRALVVDEVICLGDICRMHERLAETLRILRDARVTGVWGNHDFGLCRPSDPGDFADKYDPELLEYARSYQPRLVRDDCHIQHMEAWLDPEVLEDLWYMEAPPCSPEGLARSFDAVPHRVLLSGHVHRWFAATPEGRVDWDGSRPLTLYRPQRWYVTVHALCLGFTAVYDTATCELTPLALTPRLEDT